MSTPSIYGEYAQYLPKILQEITDPIIAANITSKKETGFKLYEHFISRIKESDSMREKCRRKNLPEPANLLSRKSVTVLEFELFVVLSMIFTKLSMSSRLSLAFLSTTRKIIF